MELAPAARALVDDPRLAGLWRAAHGRLEATGGRLEGAAAAVRDPSDDERLAVDRVLGSRSRGRDLRVPLLRLDALLQERAGATLAVVVAEAVGPVRDRPGERLATEAGERAMWAAAGDHMAVARHPRLAEWLERLRATGRWRALDDPTARIAQALDVLDRLPAEVPVGRSRLAATVLGDSHALDATAPLGRLVVAALAHLAGDPEAAPTSGGRRRLWSEVGIEDDETSSTVLTLGLRPVCIGPLTEAACRWADGGTPLPVPLAALTAEAWAVPPGTLVRVCENPSVLHAAAARLGPACPPLVCVEGNPSVAATGLLERVGRAGTRLAYHGDFGVGGIAIGNRVIGALGAEPWRFSTPDLADALTRAHEAGLGCVPLKGPVPPACWDADLAPAIEAAGVEAEEELVIDLLLHDLAP